MMSYEPPDISKGIVSGARRWVAEGFGKRFEYLVVPLDEGNKWVVYERDFLGKRIRKRFIKFLNLE